jgi:simple sugar transport system permease protein
VYVAFLLVPAAWLLLYRTKWGFVIRAAGELPRAVESAGVNVIGLRWISVLTAGFFAGLAGVFLVLGDVGIFQQGMSAGRGFLALVVVIFGRWHPAGVLAAALVIGGVDALQIRIASSPSMPTEVWLVTAIVLVALVAYRLKAHPRLVSPRSVAITLALASASFVAFFVAPSVTLPERLWQTLPFVLALAVLGGAITRGHMPSQLTIPYRRE